MKNILGIIVVAFLMVACQEQHKIAFLDNGKVINAYQEKIDVEAKFKLKDEAFKQRTDSIGKAFQLEVQDFQINGAKLSRQKQEEQSQALGQKQQILQQRVQMEQQNLTKEFNTEIDSVLSHVQSFVEDFGKKNKYDFILGKNEAGSVMYGIEANDITQTIIDELNAEYKK